MKIRVCDVCKGKEKLVKATNRTTFRRRSNLNIDLCNDHKEYLKGLSFEEAVKRATELLYPL